MTQILRGIYPEILALLAVWVLTTAMRAETGSLSERLAEILLQLKDIRESVEEGLRGIGDTVDALEKEQEGIRATLHSIESIVERIDEKDPL